MKSIVNIVQKPSNILLAIALVCYSLVGCDRTRKTKGWDYAPDMYYSDAIETYTQKLPATLPSHTLSQISNTYPYQKTETDRNKAGIQLINKTTNSPKSIKKGKQQYQIFCINCHGAKADGKGNLYTSKKYTYPPASLITQKMRAAPPAEIYHVMIVGHGIMLPYNYMITEENRWHIVNYIYNELQIVNTQTK